MNLTRCVVLGGGGVAGIAWEIGVLYELERLRLGLVRADLLVGTSAGSFAACALGAGTLELRYREQFEPSSEIPAAFAPDLLEAYGRIVEDYHGNATAIGRAFGQLACSATTVSSRARLNVIARRLGVASWPSDRLNFTAIDADTGELAVLNSESGIGIVKAAAASGAVPGVWPVVTAGGRRWIDGGMYSGVNLHLAAGFNRVLVLAPAAGLDTGAASVAESATQLRSNGAGVFVVETDEQSRTAIGPNPFDPDRRAAAADAGVRQAREISASVSALWELT